MPQPIATPRPARPEEVPAVAALVDAAYGHYVTRIGRAPGPMGDDYAQRVAAHQVWVLADDAGLTGVLVLEDEPDALLLDNVAVSPAAQGRGLGRVLIGFAEAEARRRGFAVLRLYTHAMMTENVALYRRVGFQEVRRVTEKGFDRVYMEKPLG